MNHTHKGFASQRSTQGRWCAVPWDLMPHVIVKLWPGKSEQQKARLAAKIAEDVMEVLHYGDESVSVAIEEIRAEDWAERVYRPDIVNAPGKLYQKPGYRM